MKIIRTSRWILGVFFLCILACNQAPEVPDPEVGLPAFPKPSEQISSIPLTRAEQAFVQAGNEFAWRLTRKMWESNPEQKSLILSPISVQYALGMLGNGADADVASRLAAVLGYEGTDAINAFCAKLISDLPKVDTTVTLALANGVLFDENYILKKPFQTAVTESYDAMVESMPFSNAESVKKRVNDWCYRHTYGRIRDILKDVDPDAFMYLMNAIYFSARWTVPFDAADTRNENFTTLSGKSVKVGMMHKTLSFHGYSESPAVQMISIPFGNGHYLMTIYLPKKSSDLTACIGDPGNLSREEAHVILSLPRFHSAYNTDLKALLAGMGLPLRPYNELVENPRGTPEISKIIHQADITVNESGSEAAAATVIEMRDIAAAPGQMQEPRTVYFTADHPFIYTIREATSGVILFTGVYTGV